MEVIHSVIYSLCLEVVVEEDKVENLMFRKPKVKESNNKSNLKMFSKVSHLNSNIKDKETAKDVKEKEEAKSKNVPNAKDKDKSSKPSKWDS